MELIKNLGLLSLGYRIRFLTEKLNADITGIYKFNKIEFNHNYTPIFYLLKDGRKIEIKEIQKEFVISIREIDNMLDELKKKGLINIVKNKNQKFIYLSIEGKKIISELELIWGDIYTAYKEFFSELDIDINDTLSKIENSLSKKSMYERIEEKSKLRAIYSVDIIDYSLPLKPYFKDLNFQWLKKYFNVEKKDEKILSNPEKYILENGGFILFARVDGFICGTVAMIKHKENIFELAKMSVSEKYLGRHIGQKLALEAIRKAKEYGAKKIFLETNKQFYDLTGLYRKLGFEEVEYPCGTKSDYAKPTIKMELNLNN